MGMQKLSTGLARGCRVGNGYRGCRHGGATEVEGR